MELITLIVLLPPLLPRMFNHGPRRMILLHKPTSKSSANRFLPATPHANRRTMVSVNTKLQLAVLAVETGVEAGEVRDGFQIFVRRFVLVLEAALVAFRAGTPQVVVVAELVVCGSAFDLVEDGGVDGYGGIEAAGTGHPGWFCNWGNWCWFLGDAVFCWNWRSDWRRRLK